jgi:hypothetical protein
MTTPQRIVITSLMLSGSLLSTAAYARPFRVAQVPNGNVNGCATCHVSSAGGGPRNVFGQVVEASFLSTPGSSGNVLWGSALAGLDSDADGRSNGSELLDPQGSWTTGSSNPGNPTQVTNPGVAQASVPALGFLGFVGLAGALLVSGIRSRQRKA